MQILIYFVENIMSLMNLLLSGVKMAVAVRKKRSPFPSKTKTAQKKYDVAQE